GETTLLACGHSKGAASLLLGEAREPGTFARLWCYEPIVFPSDERLEPRHDFPLSEGARRRRAVWPSRDEAFASYGSKPPLDVLVLLQQGFDPGRPEAGTWWITPGGGVNNGESVEDAAVREVLEETGLHLSPAQLGPVIATRVAHFEFDGRQFRQSESFFVVHVAAVAPQHHGWDEVEQRALLDHRWWSVAELRTTDET